jgi:phage gp16-like protein
MATDKASGQEAGGRSEIDERNVVGVAFGDLAEEDQRRIKEEMRRELEEVEAAKMGEKLACYQKTRSVVV